MVERFVASTGTISIGTGESTVVGVGTLFGGRDREGAQVWVHPAAAAPYRIGSVAAVDPPGEYDHLELPLVHPWCGAPVASQPYELVDGVALASGTTQAAIYARFSAFLQQSMGLAGSLADDIDWSLVPAESLFVDRVTRTVRQWHNGLLETVYVVGTPFNPRGAWAGGTEYARNDLVTNDGFVAISNHDENEGNEPGSGSDEHWTIVALAGGDGREVELDVDDGWVVWRYVGETEWTQLYAVPDDLVTSTDVTTIVKISQAAFEALDPPDAGTLYLIVEDSP